MQNLVAALQTKAIFAFVQADERGLDEGDSLLAAALGAESPDLVLPDPS